MTWSLKGYTSDWLRGPLECSWSLRCDAADTSCHPLSSSQRTIFIKHPLNAVSKIGPSTSVPNLPWLTHVTPPTFTMTELLAHMLPPLKLFFFSNKYIVFLPSLDILHNRPILPLQISLFFYLHNYIGLASPWLTSYPKSVILLWFFILPQISPSPLVLSFGVDWIMPLYLMITRNEKYLKPHVDGQSN